MTNPPRRHEMLIAILIGGAMITVNMGIQVWAVSVVITFYQRQSSDSLKNPVLHMSKNLSIAMLFLLFAHLLQFSTWAAVFMSLGEFQDFATAFYHSTVNFTSLGYGDIVMSERWRLLGAMEAANGVLMFGLTAGLVLSIMNYQFTRHQAQRKAAENDHSD